MTTAIAPALTTGWEPQLPDADSLCLRWLRHWSDQLALFAAAAGGSVLAGEGYLLADHRRPASFFNAAVLLAPPRDSSVFGSVLDEIEGHAAGGAGDLYLWSLWPTPDLRPRGWELDGHPPLMVRPPSTVFPGPPAEGARDPERVTSAAGLAAWERVLVEGYPLPELQPFRPRALLDPALLEDARIRFWTSDDGDGGPVAASAQFVAHGLAGFATGVTRPAARRGGHWRAHALTRLRTEPDLWHAGAFSDDSRPGAERLGFVPVLRHTLWHRPR